MSGYSRSKEMNVLSRVRDIPAKMDSSSPFPRTRRIGLLWVCCRNLPFGGLDSARGTVFAWRRDFASTAATSIRVLLLLKQGWNGPSRSRDVGADKEPVDLPVSKQFS